MVLSRLWPLAVIPANFSLASRRSLLLVASLPTLCAILPAAAQSGNARPIASMAYAGANTSIGVGYDTRTKVSGEISHTFSADERSAWLGSLWVGDQAGGLQVDYHWLTDDHSKVAKAFIAWDRNNWNDQKVTLGGGAEYPTWFWGAYLSSALTHTRHTGTTTTSATETLTGVDASGPYRQDFTTVTTTRLFERPYDNGVGVRVGHFYEDALLRLTVGADREWGKAASHQNTLSFGVEKFFAGSPHSVMLVASLANRAGNFETRSNERRVGIYWHYALDGKEHSTWRPTRSARKIAETPAETPLRAVPVPAEPSKQIVKVSELVSAETFFDLDRATLKPQATKVLDGLAERVGKANLLGPLQVVGHTCNLGQPAYNQRLSERRAAAVRDYLVNSAGLPAEKVVASGKGQTEPKYPNTPVERHLNRRCDIEFTVVTDQIKMPPAGPAALATPPEVAATSPEEEEALPSPWAERALRNPVAHKREVDFYRTTETSSVVTASPRVYLNRAPLAADDEFSWLGSHMPVIMDVLANDSDPDGDAIHIVSATNGVWGGVTILPDGRLRYMWTVIHPGVEHLTYTIADPYGATSTANITLTINDP